MLYIIVYNTRGLVEQGGLVQFYRVYYTIIIYHNRLKIKSKMELRGKEIVYMIPLVGELKV